MKLQTPPSELALAFEPLKPVIFKAIGFSTLISLLALAPTVYMLEVYDRVVNSRSGMTLAMRRSRSNSFGVTCSATSSRVCCGS